jgi:ribosomal protein L12E/L44/L45/RPP1/RPP2
MDNPRTYFIEGYGMIDNYRPRDYALSIDSIRIGQKDFINALVLRYKCVTDKHITLERNTPQQIDNQKDYLWQNNLKYQCTEFKNERGLLARAVFTVASEVPVTARFAADFENAKIMLQVKNLNGFTMSEFVYNADEITQELLDEFAKFLLDQPHKLRELGVHQLARRTMVRPASQVKGAHYPNANAAAKPESDEEDDDEDDEDSGGKGFFGRIKSILS